MNQISLILLIKFLSHNNLFKFCVYVIEKRLSHGTINSIYKIYSIYSPFYTFLSHVKRITRLTTSLREYFCNRRDTFIYLFCNIRDTFRFSFVRHALRRNFLPRNRRLFFRQFRGRNEESESRLVPVESTKCYFVLATITAKRGEGRAGRRPRSKWLMASSCKVLNVVSPISAWKSFPTFSLWIPRERL